MVPQKGMKFYNKRKRVREKNWVKIILSRKLWLPTEKKPLKNGVGIIQAKVDSIIVPFIAHGGLNILQMQQCLY